MVCCCGFLFEQRAHAKQPRKRPRRPGLLQSSKDRAKALGLVFVEEFQFRWLGCAVCLGRLHASG